MADKGLINVRGMNCRPELDEKFNKWYNGVHIPMLIKNKAMKRASRYKRIGDDESYPKYLAVYEFESKEGFNAYNSGPELVEALEDLEATWKEEDTESVWRVQYEVIQTWEK